MPSGSCPEWRAGKPTVRGAQLPGVEQDAQEANAGGRKAAGNQDVMAALQAAVLDNRPDTRPCAWLRKLADVGR